MHEDIYEIEGQEPLSLLYVPPERPPSEENVVRDSQQSKIMIIKSNANSADRTLSED